MFWFFVAAFCLGIFGLIGWFNHLRNQKFKAAVQAKTDRFNKLLDSFSTENDLLEFLNSDKGPVILSTLTSTVKGTKVPILVAASVGIVALFMGLGATVIALTIEKDMVFGAVMMSAMGLGLLTASGISYRLARKWGLFDDDTDDNKQSRCEPEITR